MNPSMRLAAASEAHSNYLPSQQYELANMESQPSSVQHDRAISRNIKGSEVPGQFDSQISLQLYGGGIGTNPSPGDVVTTVTNNMQSTQASTIPTQHVGGLSKKGRGKHALAGVKGGQKRIPTNQKQLEARRKMVENAESESTSADQQSNSSKNQAYDMI
jgi:hypothetical protein